MSTKEGWLKKKSPSTFAGDQKRYFVLRDLRVDYYQEQTDVAKGKPKGVIPLRCAANRGLPAFAP